MSSPVPYLGSKISLISKSEIRYEGILYTIDAQESIIALAKVRSFGTEDRQTEMPVPARDEVYEYIIFRGTDIKKIEVCESPKQQPMGAIHNDPAIVQASSFGGIRPSLGPIGGGAPSFGAPSYGQSMSQQGLSLGPGFSGAAVSPAGASQGPASSSASEFPQSTAAPAAAEPVLRGSEGGVSQAPGPIGGMPRPLMNTNDRRQQATGLPYSSPARSKGPETASPTQSPSQLGMVTGGRKSPVSDAGVQVTPPHGQSPSDGRRRNNNRQDNRPQRDGGGMGGGGMRRPMHPNQGGYNQGYNHGYNQGYNQGPQFRNQYQNQFYGRGGGGGMGRGGGGMGANRGGGGRRPRGGMMGRGGPGGQGLYVPNNRQREDKRLFEKDYDFEQANTKFEELRVQLASTKIGGTSPVPAGGPENGEANGTAEREKKEDSGNETGVADDASADEQSTFYDRSKSFFDNISCEAVERSQGRSQRPDWRLERKINQETFGVASARRGNYFGGRGRGGYYNRGGGGYYRGGYNQGYYRGGGGGMGGGHYRGRGGHRGGGGNHPNNSNGVGGGRNEGNPSNQGSDAATSAPVASQS